MHVRRYAIVFALIAMLLPAAFASVTPYPPYPGAAESISYKVTIDGQPVFTYRFPTFNQFRWMDYAGFSMTGRVHVTITSLVNDRNVITCFIRPLAFNIHPQISGKTVSFDLDQPRYLLVFINEEPTFQSNALMLFAEPPENNPPRPGDPNVVNIMDYRVDNTGKTLDTDTINQAIRDVSAGPSGGVLFFPAGVYLTGTVDMQSNVKLYVDAGAQIRGSRSSADYHAPPAPPGSRPFNRAFFIFDNIRNAGLMGRGSIDMQGYPWLWHDFQPDDTEDTGARTEEGMVADPHKTGIKGYEIIHCNNISFQGLTLLRSAYWTTTVTDTDNFTVTNIKLVNRKQQYHDDAYDITGNSKKILIQDSFAMTMDDGFAFYGAPSSTVEDVTVKNYVDYSYTSAVAIGYGGAPNVQHLRFENVYFVSNQNKFALWIQLSPAYSVGKLYEGSRWSDGITLNDFKFINTTFGDDGGQIYIDGGHDALTNFVFENCTFGKATRPGLMMGKGVAPILFKHDMMDGKPLRSVEQMRQDGNEVDVPVKFEP